MPKAKSKTPTLKPAIATKIAKVDSEKDVLLVQKSNLEFHEVEVKTPIIKNTQGEDVAIEDYFFATEGTRAIAPPFFNKSMGYPVDREDLIEIFDKIFKPEDNFVFLKSRDKEVYGVLVPLKFTDIGMEEEALLGDCQFHAVSFILDGSVNYDKLKNSLQKVAINIDYNNR